MGRRKVFDLFCPLCVVRHLSLSLLCSVPLLSTGFVSGFYCCVSIGLCRFVAFFSNGILSCFSLSLHLASWLLCASWYLSSGVFKCSKLSRALSVRFDGHRVKPFWVFAYWWVFSCFKLSRALSVGFDGHRVKPFVACEYGMRIRLYGFSCIFLCFLLLLAPSSWRMICIHTSLHFCFLSCSFWPRRF